MKSRIQQLLFSKPLVDVAGLFGLPNRVGRVLYLAGREFRRNFCFERAAGLAFALVISLIPLAVLIFSAAALFGVGDAAVDYAKKELIPLLAPDFQAKLSTWLDENISKDAFRSSVVGLVNFVAFVGLVVSGLGAILAAERHFNALWRAKRSRNYLQRLVTFWSILTTSPFLFMLSIWAGDFLARKGGTFETYARGSWLLQNAYGFILPVTLGFFAFSLLYYGLPYAQVRFRSAAVGGLAVAILWVVTKSTFYLYVARSGTLYGSLAIFPLFLIWIYVNCVILLGGCVLSYVHQHLEILSEEYERGRGRLALPTPYIGIALLESVGKDFQAGTRSRIVKAVAESLDVLGADVDAAARRLVGAGILFEDPEVPGSFVLAKAPEAIDLAEVVHSLAEDEVPEGAEVGRGSRPAEVSRVAVGDLFRAAQEAYRGTFRGRTLADLLPVRNPGLH